MTQRRTVDCSPALLGGLAALLLTAAAHAQMPAAKQADLDRHVAAARAAAGTEHAGMVDRLCPGPDGGRGDPPDGRRRGRRPAARSAARSLARRVRRKCSTTSTSSA